VNYRYPRIRKRYGPAGGQSGLHYDAGFLTEKDRGEIVAWLRTLHPLWEYRFSEHRPLPEGESQRRLLRPVYWLGSWQFACLDYYRPPKGERNRAIRAEPYPPVLARLVRDIEGRTRKMFHGADLPRGWALTTCLVNFYGRRREGEKWVDTARRWCRCRWASGRSFIS
jgi:DNA oxidative demethylase